MCEQTGARSKTRFAPGTPCVSHKRPAEAVTPPPPSPALQRQHSSPRFGDRGNRRGPSKRRGAQIVDDFGAVFTHVDGVEPKLLVELFLDGKHALNAAGLGRFGANGTGLGSARRRLGLDDGRCRRGQGDRRGRWREIGGIEGLGGARIRPRTSRASPNRCGFQDQGYRRGGRSWVGLQSWAK